METTSKLTPAIPLNRQLRRHLEAEERKAKNTKNDVNLITVQETAYDILREDLKTYGNSLSLDHEKALHALVMLYTQIVQGKLKGRYGFGLPCGMGKTSSVVAFITALHRLGYDHISVAVSAAKVEALCQLKRDLMGHGVPESKIGLIHSYRHNAEKTQEAEAINTPPPEGFASEPKTEDNDSRQFMLVTHNRIRMGDTALELFNRYQGKPRSLLIWDESLIVSETVAIKAIDLERQIGHLRPSEQLNGKYGPLLAYLDQSLQIIKDKLASKESCLVNLPHRLDGEIQVFKQLLGNSSLYDTLRNLLDISQEPIRVIPTGQGGVIYYLVSVPKELTNIVVLDASYPIRELTKLDKTIKDAELHIPHFKHLKSLSQIKRYDRVTVHHMAAGGGRSTIEPDFGEDYPSNRKVSNDVSKVVSSVPDTEAVLIFTYKRRPGDKLDMSDILLKDMERVGINVNAKIDTPFGLKPRMAVITWGMETNLNNYSHCKHVILAGVLQRSTIDLAGNICGQTDNLHAEVNQGKINTLQDSEIAHLIYQAASRGHCRTIDDQGQAGEMDLYVIHKNQDFKPYLDKVMPGMKWVRWDGQYSDEKMGRIQQTARTIVDYLGSLPQEMNKISSRELKKVLSLDDLPNRTFTYALQEVLVMDIGFILQGRSLVRGSFIFN